MVANISLGAKSVSLFLVMAAFCLVPLLMTSVRKYARLASLLGTGALLGICFFDLVPDVIELGGTKSLLWVGLVGVIYSLEHTFHTKNTADPHLHGHDHQSPKSFLISMVIHGFASGILLFTSSRLVGRLEQSVFLALLAHKAYESIIVSTLVVEKTATRARAAILLGVYVLALPLGTLIAHAFSNQMSTAVSLLATELALGTLLGCLVFDFIGPSLKEFQKNKMALIWVILGLGFTEILMRSFNHAP